MNSPMTQSEDNEFRMVMLKDIPYFHQLYAKYHDPQYLEIIKNLTEYEKTLKSREYPPLKERTVK